jgi:uncharacterized membrane protein YphA (DoxX/SURF4 family)
MDVIVLIGRILFALLFLFSGVAHLRATDTMAGYAQSKGVPNARIGVLASGVLILVGAVMLILGVWADLGALFIALFLIPTALLMHAFWKETDAGAKMQEQIQFNKDIALAGAALALFAFFAYVGDDLGLTLTGPLFDLS